MASAPGPSLLWSFNGSNVDSVTGLSQNFGTWSPTSTQYAPTYVNGLYNQAIYFNNTTEVSGGQGNCYTRYGITNYGLTSNTLTFSAWIKPSQRPYVGEIIFFNLNGGAYNYHATDVNDAIVFHTNGSPSLYKPGPTLKIGSWNHIAVSYSNLNSTSTSNTGISYYFNGGLTFTGNVVSQSFTDLYMGAAFTNQGGTFQTQDVRIYNSALSASQIFGIYQSQGIPPTLTMTSAQTVQPTYNWPFNGSFNCIVTGLGFNQSNIAGTDYNGNSPAWPYYDYTGQRVGSSALLLNNSLTPNASNLLGLNTGFTCNFPFTCSFWVRVNALGTAGGNMQLIKFVNISNFGTGNSNTMTITVPNTLNYITSAFSGTGSTSSQRNINFSLGQWIHVAIVADLNQVQVYVNGIPGSVGVPSLPYSSTTTYTSFAMIAQAGRGLVSGSTISCEYNDLRIYSGQALSTSQIQTIYQSGGIPPTLTTTSVNLPVPSLLFSLNGTTNDSILGIQGTVVGSTQYVTGRYGRAFNFLNTQGSAASNYITATQSAVTFSNTAGFSTSFWVNPTPAQTATQYWFGIFNGVTEILRGSVTSGAGNGLQIYLAQASIYPTTRTFIPSLQWSHVAFVINATTISMYFNGVYQSVASGVYTSLGLSSFTGPIQLGSSQAGSNFGLLGYMQDFRMYNTALSAQQIQAIYKSGGIPPRASLTSG